MAYPKGGVHPKLVGDRTAARVLASLLEVYEVVLLPFGENQRYDLVVEDGPRFIRVQCKTGRLRDGAVRFAACSNNFHHPNRKEGERYRHPYKGQADLFGVFCPDNRKVYLVPVDEIGDRLGTLRIDRPLNNQARGIRWAGDYELTAPVVPADKEKRPVETLKAPQGHASLFEDHPGYSV